MSDMYSQHRRMSKRQTLDGGVSIYDGGVSDGDKTITAIVNVNKKSLTRALDLQRMYNRLTISTPLAVYIGLIESVSYIAPAMTLTLSIERKI